MKFGIFFLSPDVTAHECIKAIHFAKRGKNRPCVFTGQRVISNIALNFFDGQFFAQNGACFNSYMLSNRAITGIPFTYYTCTIQ